MLRNWLSSAVSRRRRTKRRPHRSIPISAEVLETRTLLSTLSVDINDPTANDPGDNLYAQIQEAVDAAAPGDQIKVHAGTYQPFTVTTDDLTIREASANSDPVIDATGSATGIALSANGVTLRGLIVENAGRDGFLVTGDSNTLADNTARNNGLATTPADGSVVGGFTFVDADHNHLTGNVAENNAWNGFLLRLDSDGNTLSGNWATDNGGSGFLVAAGTDIFTATPDQTSDGTTFTNNSATGNSLNGLVVSGGTRINLGPVIVIEFFPAVGTTFINNTAGGNQSAGIVASITDGTRIIGNKSSDNRVDGIVVSNGNHATVAGNVSENNGFSGFFLPNADNSAFTGNTATNNGRMFPGIGFEVSGNDGNSFTGNTASGNPFGGFDLVASNDNALKGNIATDNGEDGFLLLGSSNNTLNGNLAESNARDGFRVQSQGLLSFRIVSFFPFRLEASLAGRRGSDNNTLQGNTARLNGGAGYHLIGAVGNTLTGNTAEDNTGDGFRVERLDVFAPVSPFLVNSGEFLGSFDSTDNVIEGNTSNDNGGWGFFVDDPLANLFADNEAVGNLLGDFNF